MMKLDELRLQERRLGEREESVYQEAKVLQEMSQEVNAFSQDNQYFLRHLSEKFYRNSCGSIIVHNAEAFAHAARKSMNQFEEAEIDIRREKLKIQEERDILIHEKNRLLKEEDRYGH